MKADPVGTTKMRQAMARVKKAKITINIDIDLLSAARAMAAKTDTPYQILINQLLRQILAQKSEEGTRLDRLERDLSLLKKKIAA